MPTPLIGAFLLDAAPVPGSAVPFVRVISGVMALVMAAVILFRRKSAVNKRD